MIIVAGIAAAVLAVVATGGDLRRLATVRLRGQVWVLVAISAQTLLVGVVGDGLSPGVSAALHVSTYALVAVFLWANRAFRGVWLIAAGGAANAAVIVANGGVMPASRWASRVAGIDDAGTTFSNSAVLDHPRLLPLGDVFAIPSSWPLANVFSIGDVVLVAAAFVVLRGICGSRSDQRHRRRRLTAPSTPTPPTTSAVPR